MKIALVVLLALALVAGILFVVKPWSDGIELTYALQFPPGYAGDRKRAAEETVDTLEKRLAGIEARWTGRASPDGRIQLRFQGLKDVPSVRRVIEKPARIEVHRLAPGEKSWLGRTPVLETRDFSGAQWTAWTGPKLPGVMLTLPPAAVAKYEAVEDALLVVVLDGVLFKETEYVMSPKGTFLIFVGAESETMAEEWAMSIRGGALPFPLGEPEVGRFRGELPR